MSAIDKYVWACGLSQLRYDESCTGWVCPSIPVVSRTDFNVTSHRRQRPAQRHQLTVAHVRHSIFADLTHWVLTVCTDQRYLVDAYFAPLAPTVSLCHLSDFLRSAAELYRLRRRQDLERTARQSRLHNVIAVLSAPSENICCSSDLSRSTAVDPIPSELLCKRTAKFLHKFHAHCD